jgi:hypothetical protein
VKKIRVTPKKYLIELENDTSIIDSVHATYIGQNYIGGPWPIQLIHKEIYKYIVNTKNTKDGNSFMKMSGNWWEVLGT